MINYGLKFSVSEVAKLLEVDGNQVKEWSFHFAEYLNPNANPHKGVEQEFTVEDICTLGYISMYWEENPDFENIKGGLNSNDQFEYPFSELATEAIPIFREFSDELLGGKIWMIGGMGSCGYFDLISLADSYKNAGDILINVGIDDDENKETIYPAIYNYRHATELYLKSVLPNYAPSHNLIKLYEKFKSLLSNKFNISPPRWFENIIVAFNDFDPGGTTFRYGVEINKDEMIIDLHHIKKLMSWFAESIHKINDRL